jgi:hypothetical protein
MGFRVDIAKAAVDRAAQLDDICSKTALKLDEKAQQTGGMAGLFLAVAFGFLKPDDLTKFLSANGRFVGFLLILLVVVFLACLAACLSVAWLRKTPAPLTHETLESLNKDLMQLRDDELTEAVQSNYFLDQLYLWEPILFVRERTNKNKARRLIWAQSLLAFGMLLAAILLILSIARAIEHS